MRALFLALALTGCASHPAIDGGAVACVRVDTLTAQTTTIYIASGVVGSLVIQVDCAMAAHLTQKGVGL